MRIVHIAAEFAPIAKAGGLGEVVLGLSRELTKQEVLVEVILPKYDLTDLSKLSHLKIEVPNFKCLEHQNAVWSCNFEECQLHLLESRHPAGFFHREKIYGAEDDIARFTYFSRAALEYLSLDKRPIDILHLHDWHVSLCAPMVRTLFTSLPVKAIILSIHNIEYQGKCAVHDLNQVGLDGASYLTPLRMQDDNPQYPQTINLLKGGIVFSDAVVPVSPTYAKEILTKEYGMGLETTMRKLKPKIHGILNGIDTTIWNPEKDPLLPESLSIHSIAKAKKSARKKFKIDESKRPWVGAITRLVPQKGTELIEEAIASTLKLGGSFLLLGSSPIPDIQAHFNELQKKYQNNPRVLLNYEYNENLAHQMYAALDFLLVPSHFEPCGLTQMIAMRYGTVPIVRATGGLKDTVFDWDNGLIPLQKRNGFLFSEISKESMNKTLERAFRLFNGDSASFLSLQKRGMQTDFSWKIPAQEYLKLYRKLLKSAFDIAPVRINVVDDRGHRIERRNSDRPKTNVLQ